MAEFDHISRERIRALLSDLEEALRQAEAVRSDVEHQMRDKSVWREHRRTDRSTSSGDVPDSDEGD